MEGGGLALVLPPKAAWFDTEYVHDIEKAALPEFFDGTHGKKKRRCTVTRIYTGDYMYSYTYVCIHMHMYALLTVRICFF